MPAHSISKIIARNSGTFYNFATNERYSQAPTWITFSIICATFSLLTFRKDISSLVDGAITVLSILIGFSFSAMFFLASSNKEKYDEPNISIEESLRRERIANISKEIFYNMSYFNLTSISCLMTSLLILSPRIDQSIKKYAEMMREPFEGLAISSIDHVSLIADFTIVFLFSILLLESGYTFSRAVSRVNYLFEQKIRPDQ